MTTRIQVTNEPPPKPQGKLCDPNKLERILKDNRRAEEYKRQGIQNNVQLNKHAKDQ